MKILVVASNYPDTVYPLSGIFNETSVLALQGLGHEVEVLSPRPFAPPLVSRLVSRWKRYQTIPAFEVRRGIRVHRPSYIQIPYFAHALSVDWSAFLGCVRLASQRHAQSGFDVILSFDLIGTAVMGWRLGQALKIPVAGWVTGRMPNTRGLRKVISQALRKFDAVFYQSQQTLEEGADLLGCPVTQMEPRNQVVLPRGIATPPSLSRKEIRTQYRQQWGAEDTDIIIMNIGRMSRAKGIAELLDGLAYSVKKNPRIKGVLVGSAPHLDDSHIIQKKLEQFPWLRSNVIVLPACQKERVWEYLCAADLFAFTSFHEGMPNSLLEAMAMGVPVVAFDIPPVREAKGNTDGIVLVPVGDVEQLANELCVLTNDLEKRMALGRGGSQIVKDRFDVHSNMASAMNTLAKLVKKRSPRAAA